MSAGGSRPGFPRRWPGRGPIPVARRCGRPVVTEDRPGTPVGGLEVDLEDVPGGGAAHHHMLEALISWCGEQAWVVQEGDVDAALVDGVGVHYLVAATRTPGPTRRTAPATRPTSSRTPHRRTRPAPAAARPARRASARSAVAPSPVAGIGWSPCHGPFCHRRRAAGGRCRFRRRPPGRPWIGGNTPDRPEVPIGSAVAR